MTAASRSLRGYLLPLCLCCCALPLLSACSFYNRLFHRSHDHGCTEKPFQGNSVELPGLTVPEGMTPPDKRNQVKIPTMTVGKITSYGDINAILAAGRADLCLLAKGHLKKPYFTRDAAEAQGFDLPWPQSYKAAKEFSLRDEYR